MTDYQIYKSAVLVILVLCVVFLAALIVQDHEPKHSIGENVGSAISEVIQL